MKLFLFIITTALTFNVWATDSFESMAKKELMPFKKALMGKLKGGMKKGAVHALNMCNTEAPAITKKFNNKVQLGRVSTKFRNPDNAPTNWMKGALKEFSASSAKNKMSPKVIKLENGKQAYVEPIYVKPLCLNCHGEKVRPEIQKALNEKYPKDNALGYKAGDFRGLFWVVSGK